jgi:D-alanyl-D-alanine carboxypeptidase/D-alanyl-D-alanine-endopeptidase (penicillin-binding protein 4)
VRARLLVAALAVASVVSAVVAVAPGLSRSKPTEAAVEPATPVFSLRRAPGALSRAVADGHLQSDLDAVLAQPSLGDARRSTCLDVHDPDGRSIYSRIDTTPLLPASNMKLLTASVALAKLGPDFRYVTPVRATGPPQDGAVGDLWLVGSGDPLLGTADYAAIAGYLMTPRPTTSLEGLADRVFNAGVRRVGRVVGDEGRYDGQRYLPTWEPNYATDPDIGPQSALEVNGGFSQNRPRAIPASAPATSAATIFANLLRARGITVGGVGEGKAPDQAVTLAQIESPPLSDVIGVMLRDSDNLTAELLVKELGARFGNAGTTAAGLGVVRSTLASLGLSSATYTGIDGSGLDRGDRLSCGLLEDILGKAGENSPIGKGVPVAGSNGTLTRRFAGTPAAGKVRAKTGSLEGVAGLSGWATGLDGRSLQFSLLSNDLPSEAAGDSLEDKVVSVLAAYPRAPAPADLGPAPVHPRPG